MTKPTPTVTPRYASSVCPVWALSGVFTRSLSSFTHEKRVAAFQAGFRAIAVQLDNTPMAGANFRELTNTIDGMRRDGWSPVGWATAGQNTSAYEDGKRQAALSRTFNIPWVVNIELWGEGPNARVTSEWMRGWLGGLVPGNMMPVMLSCLSSVTASFARSMDYQPFVDYPKCAISPQVYCASQPLYTLPAMRGSFAKSVVPADRIMPTCNVEPGKPVPPRYRNWRGPRWLWTGEDCQPGDFAKVLAQ
jgi:hypothetical protein